jgi:hypothetical protein
MYKIHTYLHTCVHTYIHLARHRCFNKCLNSKLQSQDLPADIAVSVHRNAAHTYLEGFACVNAPGSNKDQRPCITWASVLRKASCPESSETSASRFSPYSFRRFSASRRIALWLSFDKRSGSGRCCSSSTGCCLIAGACAFTVAISISKRPAASLSPAISCESS